MPASARYWHTIDAERIQCDLCPRHCTLLNKQRGFCFVRQNLNGQLISTVYGQSSGFCIDPIEKKPLYHFYPGSEVLSFGTIGCNLGCIFCQNWNLSKSQDMGLMTETASPQAIAKAAQRAGCKSVAFTYNDPVIFAEYVIDTAKACRELGIKTVAVTAGYIEPSAREDFFSHIDAANIDLKAFSEEFYQKFSNASLQPVLDTILYLKKKTSVWIEITNLVIPTLNDSDNEIDNMTKWILNYCGPNVPLHFSAFHPGYKLTNIPKTPIETLQKARTIAMQNGLQYVYTGNIVDQAGSTTFCPQCHQKILLRDWFKITECHLFDGNKCEKCGALIAGSF